MSNDAFVYWLVNGAPDVTYEEHLFLKRKEAFGTGETKTFEDYDMAILSAREANTAAREAYREKRAAPTYTEKQHLIDTVEQARQRERGGCSMEVYFLREGGLGLIKIGTSTSVMSRVRTLSQGFPHSLDLLATMMGGYGVEAVVHAHFKYARVRGEWFRPVPALLEYVAEIEWSEQARQRCTVEFACPCCLNDRIITRPAITERGEVLRCWQCGGECKDGVRVWPLETPCCNLAWFDAFLRDMARKP